MHEIRIYKKLFKNNSSQFPFSKEKQILNTNKTWGNNKKYTSQIKIFLISLCSMKKFFLKTWYPAFWNTSTFAELRSRKKINDKSRGERVGVQCHLRAINISGKTQSKWNVAREQRTRDAIDKTKESQNGCHSNIRWKLGRGETLVGRSTMARIYLTKSGSSDITRINTFRKGLIQAIFVPFHSP